MDSVQYLCELLPKSQTSAGTAVAAGELLTQAGFREISLSDDWCIYPGKSYFTRAYDGTVVAFRAGKRMGYQDIVKIAAAHTDHPCLAIKNSGVLKNGRYRRINVEVYGGAILNTWLDRPLGIAGSVAVRSDIPLRPAMKYVNIDEPVLFIPNLAIHMNREVNKGVELNRQNDIAPLITIAEDELSNEDYLINLVAERLDVKKEDIIDFELYAYVLEKPVIAGIKKEFIMSPAIDNIASVAACLEGIIECENEHDLNMIALFDNEEIGNRTKNGAASGLLYTIIRKIFLSIGRTEENIIESIHDGFLLSLDAAHAMHPAHMEKADPGEKVYLNNGIVIKKAASRSYATDCEASAVIMELCRKNNIPYQVFYNRSDVAGGSTLGCAASSEISMRCADVGIPMLAMHSAVETMGIKDQQHLSALVKAFFL